MDAKARSQRTRNIAGTSSCPGMKVSQGRKQRRQFSFGAALTAAQDCVRAQDTK